MGKIVRTVYMTIRADIEYQGEDGFSQSDAEDIAVDIKFPPQIVNSCEVNLTMCGVNEH